MKRILLATKMQSDTTSFLRAFGAFNHPSLRDVCVTVIPPEGTRWISQWTSYMNVDLVYLHRPSSLVDYEVIRQTKLHGIPLWIDMDDDLENITSDNPVFENYAVPQTKQTIDYAIEHADVLSVGGIRHWKRLKNSRKVYHIPGALDDRLLKFKKPFKYSNKVAWRGSESHKIDLIKNAYLIDYFLQDYEWVFFGFNPFWLKDGKYKWSGIQNLFEFIDTICEYNATRHVVFLEDNEFNRVKSNLSVMDAALAGSCVFAPNFEEFNKIPGLFLYEKPSNLERFFLLTESELRERHEATWNYLVKNLLLSKINEIRREILEKI